MPCLDHEARLRSLRSTLAKIEGFPFPGHGAEDSLSFGVPAIDRSLAGGLARGAIHECWPLSSLHLGAALGFALALAARAGGQKRDLIFIQPDFGALDGGGLYGPGLDDYGLASHRLIHLAAPRPIDAIWAMEEALRCRAAGAVLAEITEDAADLTMTRRLSLAARDGGGLGLLLRHRKTALASAAASRWEISCAPGPRDEFGGLGRTAFAVSLIRNRRGPTGRWLISWDHHERIFSSALSLGVAETARDRQDRAPLARSG